MYLNMGDFMPVQMAGRRGVGDFLPVQMGDFMPVQMAGMGACSCSGGARGMGASSALQTLRDKVSSRRAELDAKKAASAAKKNGGLAPSPPPSSALTPMNVALGVGVLAAVAWAAKRYSR